MPNEKQPKKLHGNKAKIDAHKHVESLNQNNRVTLSNRKQGETPLVDDKDVTYARRFTEENKK